VNLEKMADSFVDLDQLASHIADGDVLALPHTFSADFSAASMITTRALIERRVKSLYLIGVPALSLQADMLIGAGCVSTIQSGSVLLYEYGPANRFIAAQKRGSIAVKDSTCPAIHAALIAGEKGLPFMPVRGLIGSDVLRHRMDQDGWRVIDNPFGENDPIVLVPALRPDVALFHVPLADRFGNVWVGRRSELATMARGAQKALVTCEAIFEGNLTESDELAPATIPALFITALSHQPNGSWPLGGGSGHPEDALHMHEYGRLSKTDEGFAQYLSRYVTKLPEAV
jgi:glutaconate CoA-transferase subunit A